MLIIIRELSELIAPPFIPNSRISQTGLNPVGSVSGLIVPVDEVAGLYHAYNSTNPNLRLYRISPVPLVEIETIIQSVSSLNFTF